MNFDCLLMSDSELLRIKNKQKASYKNRKTARSILKNHYTPNDRFGFNYSLNSFVIVNVKLYICMLHLCHVQCDAILLHES